MVGRGNPVTSYGRCDHCGQYGAQANYDGRKWGTLYFVPLIPMGGHVRVLSECGKCKRGAHVPRVQLDQIAEATVEQAFAAIDRLGKGEVQYANDDGSQGHAAGDLAGALGTIYRTKGPAEAKQMMNEARDAASGQPAALDVAEGVLNEAEGDVETALAFYGQAASASEGDAMPLYLRASLLRSMGRGDEAVEAYHKLVEAAPQDVGVRLELVDLLTALNRHGEAVDQFEATFSMVPELRGEKKFVKLYRKACKKARRDPTV